MTAYKVGDRVSVDHDKYPGVWIVRKLAPVNATLEPVNGGRGLKCPRTMLIDPITEIPVAGANGATVTAVPMPPPKVFYSLGEFVRIDTGKYAGIWVVIKDDGGERVNLAKPGGDGERYLRVTRRGLKKVDVSEVMK